MVNQTQPQNNQTAAFKSGENEVAFKDKELAPDRARVEEGLSDCVSESLIDVARVVLHQPSECSNHKFAEYVTISLMQE